VFHFRYNLSDSPSSFVGQVITGPPRWPNSPAPSSPASSQSPRPGRCPRRSRTLRVSVVSSADIYEFDDNGQVASITSYAVELDA